MWLLESVSIQSNSHCVQNTDVMTVYFQQEDLCESLITLGLLNNDINCFTFFLLLSISGWTETKGRAAGGRQ